ncbi:MULTISPECIES: holin [Bacteria]|uniref:holin n=1 Tax=Bacteria TaxID=2 RepID=UPI003C7C2C94
MTLPRTRAERRAATALDSRPALFTARFWADLVERVITSAAGGALAALTATGFDIGSPAAWIGVAAGAGVAALVSLLKGIAASGSGSPSLAPGV